MVFYYMKDKEKSIYLLKYMISLCHKIYYLKDRFGYNIDDFSHDEAYQLAVCMVIIDFGESANKLSKYLEKDNPQFPWKDVIGMRNIFAYNYMGINFDEVWTAINEDIPILEEQLNKMLHKIQK